MNTIVCGRMKEGKTTFAIHLARKWSPGVIVWDPRHMIEGEVYVQDAEELEDAINEMRDAIASGERFGLIVYRPDGLDSTKSFEEMCSVLFNPPERFHHFALVIDEANTLQSAHQISPHLSLAVRQHPRSVAIIQTSHSMQDWHRASKDLINHLYCFRLIGRSLKSVIEFCDGSEEMETTIKNLPRHHCIHINFEAPAGSPEFTVLNEPEKWYSHATEQASNESV